MASRNTMGIYGQTADVLLDQECDMTTFTVWKFDDPDGAERAMKILQESQADGLVKVDDHAIVAWPKYPPSRGSSLSTRRLKGAR